MAKVTIQIVTWNSRSYLPECLAGIRAQTYRDFDVTFVDNASVDGTVSALETQGFSGQRLLRNTRNLGFARAHNMGFKLSQSPYILVMNPDVLLEPETLERLVAALEAHPECGSIGGRLLRYDVLPGELREIQKTRIIDSAWIQPSRSRRFLNRGEGEIDGGQWHVSKHAFGISGSLVLFRRAALNDAMIDGEIFANDFHSYLEDADLAWRLQWRGWQSWYEAGAVAYHRREIRTAIGSKNLLRAHRHRSMAINRLSYKNHFLAFVRNEAALSALRNSPWIISRELAMTGGYLIATPRIFSILPILFHQLPRAYRHRRMIARGRRVKPSEINRWFR